MTVTFFGHSNAPQDIRPKLKSVLVDLIKNKNATMFYVGNHGNFDAMVKSTLKELKHAFPHINYAVVLAYLPIKRSELEYKYYLDTIVPDGIESVPPKYAIVKRNRWMIDNSDTVVTYVKYIVGGAVQFKTLAEKKGKTVINIADE
ncbi:MAG: hypothetical protein IJ370_03085 [Oscillospiraceae bacterium]|nr:hypothetical protein [Oscillospiraceae bacterium]